MRAFQPAGNGLLRAEFDPVEAALLTQLASQVAGILSEGISENAPDDPAIAKLLPDAYTDDTQASAEFRRFTAQELIAGKVGNAQTVIADIADALVADTATEVLLDAQATQAWLRGLTDIRLVLATRLGIEKDGDPGRESDEAFLLGDIYDWLGWVQESLVNALED